MTSPFAPGVPGIYRLREADYRKAQGIAQSDLKFMAKSPAHYQAHMQEEAEAPTDAQILGMVTHAAILENRDVADIAMVRPLDMDLRTKEGKKLKARAEECASPVIRWEEAAAITGMTLAIARHEIGSAALWQTPGQNEICLFAQHEPTRLLRKGRLDRLTEDSQGQPLIVDLKTTDDASPRGFSDSIARYRYHVQAAYYTDLAEANGIESPLFMFIAVEKAPPYAVACYVLDPKDIAEGRRVYEAELAELADCMANNKWPAYGEGITRISLPKWARREAA